RASAAPRNSRRRWKQLSGKAACIWWWRRSTTAKTCACWCMNCIRCDDVDPGEVIARSTFDPIFKERRAAPDCAALHPGYPPRWVAVADGFHIAHLGLLRRMKNLMVTAMGVPSAIQQK